jgi:hypothetical protein
MDDMFYDKNQIMPMIENQVMFVKSENDDKKFHQFKMIEILRDCEARVLFTF